VLGKNDIELPILYSEHLTGDGQEVFEHAAKLNWEGIVSKNANAPYRSDRNESWLKVKCDVVLRFYGQTDSIGTAPRVVASADF
jgi:ATP-dependent DNA ligase